MSPFTFVIYFLFLFLFFECASLKEQPRSRILNLGFCRLEVLESVGNTVYHFGSSDQNILFFPIQTSEYKESPRLHGIPFLYPWSNRLRENRMDWGDKDSILNLQNADLRLDSFGLPIHGLILKSSNWSFVEKRVEESFTSVLFKHDNLQELEKFFPFSHSLEMEIRLLSDSKPQKEKVCELEINVILKNLGQKKMPVNLGFHPYFKKQTPYKLINPAQKFYEMDNRKLPTGNLLPVEKLKNLDSLDHVFVKSPGQVFGVEFSQYKIEVKADDSYKNILLFTPQDKDFVCVEPMTSPTDPFHLHKSGRFSMEFLEPNQKKKYSYSIKVTWNKNE